MRTVDAEGADTSIQGREPPATRRVTMVGVGLLGIFVGLAVWGLGSDPVVEGPEMESLPGTAMKGNDATAPVGTAGPVSNPGEGNGGDDVSPVLASGRVHPPREISALLDAKFQVRGAGVVLQSLRAALGPARNVGVVNLWATYCAPCKQEFPGFRELQRGWGDEVRFVPIQLGDDDAGSLGAIMPAAPASLIDTTTEGLVQSMLLKSRLLPADPPIPITLVLDCKRRVRWLQTGEVKDMTAFDAVVTELRAELRTGACARADAKTTDELEDWVRAATDRPGQSLKSSGKCPPCRPDQQCVWTAQGNGICVDDPA